jgi:hypothetical protein
VPKPGGATAEASAEWPGGNGGVDMGLVRRLTGGAEAAGAEAGPAGPPDFGGRAGRADGRGAVPGREASLGAFGALAGTQKWPLQRGQTA